MKDNIQNLIKNVIEENAVRAKEQANKALYEKVGNRLKNEYINVSRRLFYNLNEVSGSDTTPSQGQQAPANDNPYLQPGGPEWRLPPGYQIPEKAPEQAPPPPRPDPSGFARGRLDDDYRKAWYEYFLWWQLQDPKWKAKNPLPPRPQKPGTPPTRRPGGGTMPGTPPSDIR